MQPIAVATSCNWVESTAHVVVRQIAMVRPGGHGMNTSFKGMYE